MKLKKQILALSLIFIVFYGCDKYIPEVPLNTIVNLAEGNKAIYKEGSTKIEVEFLNVIEDSRCPEGAVCIWAGRFLGKFRFDGQELTLGNGDLQGSYSSKDTINGFIISLEEVETKKMNQNYNSDWSPILKVKVSN